MLVLTASHRHTVARQPRPSPLLNDRGRTAITSLAIITQGLVMGWRGKPLGLADSLHAAWHEALSRERWQQLAPRDISWGHFTAWGAHHAEVWRSRPPALLQPHPRYEAADVCGLGA